MDMLKIAASLVVTCELIAFITWILYFSRWKEIRYKLFTIYLGIISVSELLNLLFSLSDNSVWNIWVLHVNIPIQFIFLMYFLLYGKNRKHNFILALFIGIYIFFFVMERLHIFVLPVNFDSMSYGIGNLLLTVSLIIALLSLFRQNDPQAYNHPMLFPIIAGMIVFYLGSFPYQNFRNIFWGNPAYYKTGYFLHYLSQAFNCIMYLSFAYSVKWKTK